MENLANLSDQTLLDLANACQRSIDDESVVGAELAESQAFQMEIFLEMRARR